MNTESSFQIDVNSIAQSLLHNEAFLTSLSQNTVFVKGLSQNKEFVSSVSKNPVFRESVINDPGYVASIKGLVNEELDNTFEGKLSHSKFQPVQRIFEIETFVGTDGFNSCENEEDEDILPLAKRIQLIEDKINNHEFRPTVSPDINKIYDSMTEKRAACLVDALEASDKGFFTASEIIEFLKCKLPDYCKLSDTVQNIRKVKQDVVNKAEKMFPHIKKNKKANGHKDVRLVCNLA